jgi:hypothetical protein
VIRLVRAVAVTHFETRLLRIKVGFQSVSAEAGSYSFYYFGKQQRSLSLLYDEKLF